MPDPLPRSVGPALCLLVCLGAGGALAEETIRGEIDRDVWSAVRRTVAGRDIAGMAALYHPDAVLVGSNGPEPIAAPLARWGKDMEESARTGASATVSFRFTSRQHGTATAFETGMFEYTVVKASGEQAPFYVPFEALLVKRDGKWRILMERQLGAADEAAWSALPAAAIEGTPNP